VLAAGRSHPAAQQSIRRCFGDTSNGAPIIRSSATLVHREQHHYAQALRAAQQYDDAVDAARDAAVRRCAE
jgi:hypothetical protein